MQIVFDLSVYLLWIKGLSAEGGRLGLFRGSIPFSSVVTMTFSGEMPKIFALYSYYLPNDFWAEKGLLT